MFASRRRNAVLGVALVYACVACAHGEAGGAERSQAAGRLLTIETPGAVRGAGDREALARAMGEVGRDAALQLKGDGRLAQLAERMAGAAVPDDDALIAHARALGLADAALLLRRVSARAADLLAAALRVEVPAAVRVIGATHYGVYVPPAGDGALVVLSRRPLALEPVPARVDEGGALRVRGRIAANVRGAKLLWRDPLGQRRAFALDGNLELDVRLPALAGGRHELQLSEQTQDGERVLLAFAVQAGDPRSEPEPLDVEHATLADVRRELTSRLGTLRAEYGLAAFTSDAGLARAADTRCSAVGEVAPAARDADAELAAEHVLARGSDLDGLYTVLVADAALRARLFEREPARLGLAVCARGNELHALALFAAPARASEGQGEQGAGRVLLAINAHRRTRGVLPLRPDAGLTRVAQEAAAALLADPAADRDAVMARANQELERFALRYRRVAAVAVVVRDLLDAATLEPALDAGANVIGIATAEQRAAGTVAVIVTLGWER